MATGGKSERVSGKKDIEYIKLLHEKANKFCGSDMEKVTHLYRNQSPEYFETIEENGNVMTPSLKDKVGDPRSIINGRLEGVFFCITLYNGDLPTISPYGSQRICIPIEALFKEDSNLYFADFYCFDKKNHYAILVLTKAGTDADNFCQANLPKLDNKNPFLKGGKEKGYTKKERKEDYTKKERKEDETKEEKEFLVTKKQGLWVEVFFTDEVNITELKKECRKNENKVYYKYDIKVTPRATDSTTKHKSCKVCNPSEDELEQMEKKLKKLTLHVKESSSSEEESD